MVNERLKEFNKKFVYIGTNPENIISANKGALFFRDNTTFFLNSSGNAKGQWVKLPYRTVVSPPPPKNVPIKYKNPTELWIKTTDGYLDALGIFSRKQGGNFSHTKMYLVCLRPEISLGFFHLQLHPTIQPARITTEAMTIIISM